MGEEMRQSRETELIVDAFEPYIASTKYTMKLMIILLDRRPKRRGVGFLTLFVLRNIRWDEPVDNWYEPAQSPTDGQWFKNYRLAHFVRLGFKPLSDRETLERLAQPPFQAELGVYIREYLRRIQAR